jgi:hypothetical protein
MTTPSAVLPVGALATPQIILGQDIIDKSKLSEEL